ncbi:MAG: protein translocase subunit SecD, partial [Planctomycetota bacterium]|nr:protein translocase subunit SecD [Planctomycetota bacterium]
LYARQDKSMTHTGDRDWSITQTYQSQDQLGRPAVAFGLDASGASLMGRLTATHIGEPMAILLDGEVYSAPTIQSQITSRGQISGNFSVEEINYLIKVLAAGSLQAQLSSEPISVSILGPSLGQDNLNRGREAFIISIVAVAAFMLLYYFFAGFLADLALIANGIIIFGSMMLIDGTFTLPGLAGIVLTIGMAVDANVLIYERIREEIFSGEYDLRGAVRQGYNKALSTILDANITNLIICAVLFYTATAEVKGFALTLTIGICATLFTALFATRQIYYLYTDLAKIRRLPMLATVVPAIHRFLEPSINWIGLRRVFWGLSGIAFIGSIVLVQARGVDMFDTEFRGGVSLTMATATVDDDNDGLPDLDANGDPIRLMLRHTGDPIAVEDRIHAIGEQADPAAATSEEERTRLAILQEFTNASILTEGDTTTDAAGNILASHFQVKVSSPKGLEDDRTITRVIVDAIVDEFGDQLDATPPLSFQGGDDDDSTSYVNPITDVELGQNIARQETRRVPEFVGGAAIMLENVAPPTTEADVAKRIERMRKQPDFAQYSARKVQVVGLTPVDPQNPRTGYRDFVVLVNDPYRSYLQVDTELWWREVADPEWMLIRRALQQPASLERVSSYSSAVAETLSAQAVVAVILSLLGILVYIWVRFGSLRYSLAAIAALVHDVVIALGLLAATAFIGTTAVGSALLIEPFRIDLGVVAALLTIIGYSLNDTIVILDRIRENRGKLPLPTARIVNRSINQTISRTLLTSVTTLVAVVIMYAEGGSGIRPFTFCLLIGLLVGTYSSVAVAAPLVLRGGGTATPAPAPATGEPATT